MNIKIVIYIRCSLIPKFNFLKNSHITSATSGNYQLIICDSSGIIHMFTKTWEANSFKGHDGEIYLCEMQRLNNLLVTIGVSYLFYYFVDDILFQFNNILV